MHQSCTLCHSPFHISQKELGFCKNLNLPFPEICPQDRLRAVMATRNEWKLYRRKCDKTGEEILSAYPPDSNLTIYKNSIWWGDSWDATDYGQTFNPSKPFFEQFLELQKTTPREGTTIFNSENCDYNGHIRNSKNCYLNALVADCEDCLYSYWITSSKDIVDSMYTNHSNLCYWCCDVKYCFGCVGLTESNNCTDCYFSYQLRGCNNCIFCTNLADKTYYIHNKKHSKEEYEKLKSETLNGSKESWQKAQKEYKEMVKKAPKRFLRMRRL